MRSVDCDSGAIPVISIILITSLFVVGFGLLWGSVVDGYSTDEYYADVDYSKNSSGDITVTIVNKGNVDYISVFELTPSDSSDLDSQEGITGEDVSGISGEIGSLKVCQREGGWKNFSEPGSSVVVNSVCSDRAEMYRIMGHRVNDGETTSGVIEDIRVETGSETGP